MEWEKGFDKKYKISRKGFGIVIEELKQDITATAQNIKGSIERNKERYKENSILKNNQRQFFQSLETTSGNIDIAPNKKEIKPLWKGI